VVLLARSGSRPLTLSAANAEDNDGARAQPQASLGRELATLALTLVGPAAYLLLWSLLGGTDGCGPPGHSTSGRISEAAPFVLPLAAAGILFAFGAKRRWRVPTLARGAITIVATSGLVEVFILLLEVGVHHCTE
jgi:hypothetical protein